MTKVKVSKNDAKVLRAIQEQILRKGTDKLKDLPVVCSECGRRQMSGIGITAEHWECECVDILKMV